MENPRPEKVAVVDEVREQFAGADAAILTEYRGLTVTEISTLRRSMAPAGVDYKVYKNTLVRFAARELGVEGLEELLVGPTAIAFVKGDAVLAAKALRDFARTNPKLVVKGGLLGDKFLTATDTAALADVPPREVLLARLAGGIAAPMQTFAGLLQALPRNFAYGLKALIEKGGAPGAPADAPAPSEGDAPAELADAPQTEPVDEAPVADAAPAEAAVPAEGDAPAELADAPQTQPTADGAAATESSDSPEDPTPNHTPTEEEGA